MNIDCKERVAFDLMTRIMGQHVLAGEINDRGKVLDLFAECLEAVSGHRNNKPKTVVQPLRM